MSGLTVLDLFCGAGGSSTGLVGAGFEVILAANHWRLAVDVHQLNHPDADHDCADISAVDPRRYPRTNVLWASPECTNHSVAKGVRRQDGQTSIFGDDEPDPSAERSRATMWDVPRFAEAMYMRGAPYEAVIVENVVDARHWLGWRGWLVAMEDLGYDHQVLYLNSAFAHGKDYGWFGAPQFRDRMYIVFTRKGAPRPDLDIRPPAWCPKCETVVDGMRWWKRPEAPWGRYRAQYVFGCPKPGCGAVLEPFALPALTAIDWSHLGVRIGDRARPLAKATRERIRAGLARYGRAMLAPAGGTWNDDAAPVDHPFRARTARENEGLACPPLMVPVEARDGLRARPAGEPLRTQTARLETGVAVPPFIAEIRSGRLRTGDIAHPFAAMVASGQHHAVIAPGGAEPFIAMLRQHCAAIGVRDPFSTMAAAGQHHGLVVPPFLAPLRSGRPRTSGVDEPLATVVANGSNHGLTVPGEIPEALLVPYYGTGVARPASRPAGTVTTRDRHALVTRRPEQVSDDEVDDCTFRMLEPGEILAAMAFPGEYRMLGVKRDRVRMAGNAVTPPAARLIGERVAAALGGAA